MAVAFGCWGAAALTAFLSWADILAYRDTPEALAVAAKLQASVGMLGSGPDAAVLERLAERRRWDLHDRDLKPLRAAVHTNPRLTSARIRLGLAQESAGDFAAAETSFREAARFDRQHLPAWTLANYFFRRDQREEFWVWASRAAERTYDDFRPLLRLVNTLEPSPAAALARLHAGGHQQAFERAYLNFLIGEERLDAAESVALRLTATDRPRIADLVDRDIRAGRTADALRLWNAIGGGLDPMHGTILTNGGFQSEPSGVAFDWKLGSCPGSAARWLKGRMEFELTGVQPDVCVLLEQPLPVAPGHRYAAVIDSSPALLSTQLENRSTESIVRLRVILRRTPGTVPFQGSVVIRTIRIEVR